MSAPMPALTPNISMNPSAGARGCPVANSAPAAGYAER